MGKNVKVIDKETLVAERFRNKLTTPVNIFAGDQHANLNTTVPQLAAKPFNVEMGSENWVDSAGYRKLWNEIGNIQYKIKAQMNGRRNAAQPPSHAALEALLGKVFIDITRRVQESPDLTGEICTEITNLEFGRTVNIREFLNYIGYMAEIRGTNDRVPLIEQYTGLTDTAHMAIRATGWKDSLANLLWNTIHEMQKVNEAAVDAHTDMRNSRHIGVIVGATFAASQKQAADTTGDTYDVKMYNTFRKAIKKLRALYNRNLDDEKARKIAVPSISVLCNSSDTWSIERVIGGQLQTNGTTGQPTSLNLSALPISRIVEYDHGITDGYVWGKKTLSFPGVTAGKCYIFVPRVYSWVLNKRPLTMETGMGSVLQLSTEERAWYSVQSEYLKILLGASDPDDPASAGYGAIIEVTLPTDS